MQWKRCSKCENLKPLDSFWNKNSEEKHSQCISCMKAYQESRKDAKKAYDHNRYLYKKGRQKKLEMVCMRCEQYRVNVRNNVMYWCFHCLSKYEKEWDIEIPVVVINPVLRKVKDE